MRIKKTSQYIEGGASLSNVYGTSDSNGYTQEYINNLETYSTTEQRVGTWVDGKPIYRKVYDISNITSSNTDLVNISSLHVEKMIKIYGCIKTSTNYIYPVPLYDSTSNYSVLFYNGTYLRGRASLGAGGTVISAYAIIEYTKTTD